MKIISSFFLAFILFLVPSLSISKELPKIAVWSLTAGNINPSYAQDLTNILVSEISKLGKYAVYSQENVRTLAGWTAERMTLGCTDAKCLTALGQMGIAKLISGGVGRVGNRYSVSLTLFDTQNARAETSVSEFGRSEDESIDLVQLAVRKLLGIEVGSSNAEEKGPGKATLPERSFVDPVTGMEFIFIKGGCFEMGDTFGDGYPEEEPVHEVCVDDFYLGKYEVTQGQWEKVMDNNPSRFKGRDNPVEQISWNVVQEYIDRLNDQRGRKYRLPTEAEWEYAARSGGKRKSIRGRAGKQIWGNMLGTITRGIKRTRSGRSDPMGWVCMTCPGMLRSGVQTGMTGTITKIALRIILEVLEMGGIVCFAAAPGASGRGSRGRRPASGASPRSGSASTAFAWACLPSSYFLSSGF